ncbi:TPA: HNH endonuclease [Acinetobacter baumannii]|uniref:HNH endonuclease n=1 Tax=Acinetobacter pittii TaxID=48296 RepID=UPI001EE57FCB|nr:HNH endonuclease [Acinetobacter pittii]MCG5265899.1 HNH endonuclease [Acinetobacter pittii]HDK8956530.1 HNH endonuclease [Acinetobacter baumannii]HDR2202663.1 HNH endonuclease [Acinetobacter baumannii]
MFNVIRSERPQNWTNSNYKDPLVVQQLKKDFFSKCYLCEQTEFGNVNVEHFVPHLNQSEELRIDWENLYYACSHCNGIKGHRHNELLNCCDQMHNVDTAISLEAPTVPNGQIVLKNTLENNSALFELTNKTIELLDKCYNNANSGVQQVSHQYLKEKILEEHAYLQSLRFQLKNGLNRLLQREKDELVERINNMLKPNYPFSAFWITYVRNDPFLSEILG